MWLYTNPIRVRSAAAGGPTGPAGGDLGSTYPNPLVLQINGVPVVSTPTNARIWVANGTQWNPIAVSGAITIDNAGLTSYVADSVTFAKIQNINTARLLGRTTAGSGDIEELTTLPFTAAVNVGGTGQTTYTDGQLLIGNTTGNTLTKNTLTQGAGMLITNGSGTITVACTITQYTDEMAQDAVGTILTDSATIDFTYNDAGNTITATVIDASITEAKQGLADVTTLDTSTSKHGYAPKLPNDATKFFDGLGLYSKLRSHQVPNCRLTLTSNTPVTTSDVTAATSVYMTPYGGNKIPLYNTGTSKWELYDFTQVTISVPATTSTMYDVFAYVSAGSVTAEAVAWTNDTTRATALVYQDGFLCKTGSLDRLFVGCFRTTGVSGQTEDSYVKRHCVSYYNRVLRPMKKVDTTDTWTYSTAAYQQANAAAANQLDFIVPYSENLVNAMVFSNVLNSTATQRTTRTGIGLDSTTVNSADIYDHAATTSTLRGYGKAYFSNFVAVGRHTLVWLEYGSGADVQTWSGDQGGITQAGIVGYIMG